MPELPQQFPFVMRSGSTGLDNRLDARCWGLYVSNYTTQWVEIPEANEFVPPNTRQILALPGTLVAKARFAAPGGVTQPVAVPGQAVLLTYTERVVQPSGGLVGTAAVQAVAVMERFARAALPAPGTAGRLASLSDYDLGLWEDTGTKWWSHTHEVFDVKGYCAVADNVTDDYAAIQACLNAAPEGAIVMFPPPATATGKYLISTQLQPKSGQVLQGSGQRPYQGATGGCVIRYSGAGDAISLSGVYGVVVKDMTIEIGAAATSCAHLIDPTSSSRWERVRFTGAGVAQGTGLLATGEVSCVCHHTFLDCTFDNLLIGVRGSGFFNANEFINPLMLVLGTAFDFSPLAPDTLGGSDNLIERAEWDGTTTLAVNLDQADRNTFLKSVNDGTTADATISASCDRNLFIGCRFANALTDNSTTTMFVGCVDSSGRGFGTKRSLSVPLGGGILRAGAPVYALQGAGTQYLAWDYPGAALEGVVFDCEMPEDAGGTQNLEIILYWTNLGAGAGNVIWQADIYRVAAGGNLNGAAPATAQDTIAAPAQNVLTRTVHTVAPAAVLNSHIMVIIYRRGDLAGDTLGNSAGLAGVRIDYRSEV